MVWSRNVGQIDVRRHFGTGAINGTVQWVGVFIQHTVYCIILDVDKISDVCGVNVDASFRGGHIYGVSR